MNTLKITDGFALPLEIITMRTATYGDSGAGKTAFGRLMAEKVHAAHHRSQEPPPLAPTEEVSLAPMPATAQ